MLKINVEGVYETDVGTNQKKYTDFNYTFKTSRLNEKGVSTHIVKRFIPMLVARDKTKKEIFSRLRSFNLLSVEVIDDKDSIIGKNIDNLNDWEIQDLACTFDLYDVPLCGKHTLNVIKEKAVSAYLKKVWNIDIAAKNSDGAPKYDIDKVVIEIPANYFEKKVKQTKKLKVSDLISKAGQIVADGILQATGNKTDDDNDSPGGFPSEDDLIKQ